MARYSHILKVTIIDSVRDLDILQQNSKISNKRFTETTRYLSVVHVLILDLNTENGEAFFILSSTSFHIFGPKLAVVSVPECTVCIFLFARCYPLLRSKFSFSWKTKTSFIISGERSCFTLQIFVAEYCTFFMWIDTDLPICIKSCKFDFLSRYTILKDLLCILLILSFRPLLCHIQTNGH